jgi:hypothetical protein
MSLNALGIGIGIGLGGEQAGPANQAVMLVYGVIHTVYTNDVSIYGV